MDGPFQANDMPGVAELLCKVAVVTRQLNAPPEALTPGATVLEVTVAVAEVVQPLDTLVAVT